MWVQINKTYAGELGQFIAGQKYDIPGHVADKLRKELGKGGLNNTCPPWEENLDRKAIEAGKLRDEAKAAISLVEHLRAKVESCQDHFNAYKEQNRADNDALDKAEKKKASNVKELDARQQISMGYCMIAEGELALAQLELKDAESKAADLAKEAGIEWPAKQPNAEPDKTEDAGNSRG